MSAKVMEPAAGLATGNWALRIMVALATYVVVAGALSPGFIALGAPVHVDVYRYFDISHKPFAWALLANPRPLMLAALRVLDVDDFRIFYALLLLVAILLPLVMLAALEQARRVRVGWTATISFLALCYVLPSFYELAPLDFGGLLAGVLACSACMVLMRQVDWPRIAGYVLLAWLSVEFKPTYAVALCAFPLVMHWSGRRSSAITAAAATFALVLLVFLKDRWLGSAFVGVDAQAGSSYQLLGMPGAMLGAVVFYVQRIFSPLGWLLVSACAGVLVWRKQGRTVVAIAVLAGAALMPMLLIPNHRFTMYAWYPASILLLLVPMTATCWQPRRFPASGIGLLAVLVFLACSGESAYLKSHRGWYTHNQLANARILDSLQQLRSHLRPGMRVLISGRLPPYAPFKNDALVARYLPAGLEWVVVAPPSEDVLIPMSGDTRRYVRTADLDGAGFDLHVVYDDIGRIVSIAPPAPGLASPGDSPAKRALLFCSPAGAADDQIDAACLQSIH